MRAASCEGNRRWCSASESPARQGRALSGQRGLQPLTVITFIASCSLLCATQSKKGSTASMYQDSRRVGGTT